MSQENTPPNRFSSIPITEKSGKEQAEDPIRVSAGPPPDPLVEPATPKHNKRRHRRGLWTIFFIIFLLSTYILSGFFLAPYLLRILLPDWATRQSDRPIAVGSVSCNPLTLAVTLHNGIIGPKQNEPDDPADPILSFGRLKLDFSFLTFLGGGAVVQQIHCNDLFVHLIRGQDSTINFNSLIQDFFAGKPDSSSSFLSLPTTYSLRNITVENSRILFDDKRNGTSHRIEELRLALPYISNLKSRQGPIGRLLANFSRLISGKDEMIRPEFSAKVNGSPMLLTGETKMTGDKVETSMSIKLQALDLADLWGFLPKNYPAVLSKGSSDLDLDLIFTTAQDSAPPTLRLKGTATLHDLWFQDKQGRELARIPHATIKGNGSPLTKNFHFSDLMLDKPILHMEKNLQGEWPLAAFFNKANDAPRDAGNPFLFSIESLKIKDGVMGVVDQTVEGGFSMSWTDIQGTASSLTMDRQKPGSFALSARIGENGGLSLQGDLSLAEGEANGMLVLKNIELSQFSPYLNLDPNINVKAGRVENLESRFQWVSAATTPFPCIFSEADLQATALSVTNKDHQYIDFKKLTLRQAGINFAEHRVNLGTITTDQADLLLEWDETGKPFWERKPSDNKSSWQILIHGVEATRSRLQIRHNGLKPPFAYAIEDISLEAKELNGPGKSGDIQVTARLPKEGSVSFSGPLTLKPLSASLITQINSLAIPALQPLLTSWLAPEITTGILQANGTLNLPSWSFSGSVEVNSFSAKSEKGEILAWQKAEAEKLHLSFRPFSLNIASLPLEKPLIIWTITGTKPPIEQFLHPRSSENIENGEKSHLQIDHLALNGGILQYRDETATPSFYLMITDLQGAATGLAQRPGNRFHFSWNGLIKKASGLGEDSISPTQADTSLSLSGSGGLFDEHAFFDMRVHVGGLPLAPLSPYLEPHLGYLVKEGKAEATISYLLENQAVKAENNLQIRGFKLGEPVADATNLPLTIAILTDSKGVINLDIPVKGGISDPTFSVRGDMAKHIRNLFIKTMASPFTLLNSFFATKSIPDAISFPFGHSELSNETKEQLANLADVLRQRPWLQLTIKGFADAKGDKDALLALRETEKIRQRLARERQIAEQIPFSYGKEEIVPFGAMPAAGAEYDSEIATKELQAIGDKALHRLARARTKSIRRYLTDSQSIATQRIIESAKTTLIQEDSLGENGNRAQFDLESLIP